MSQAVGMQAAHEGEAWVRDLEAQEYSQLGLDTRLAILATLVAAVLDSPSLRACLEMRLEENQRIRRQMFEEARVPPPRPILCNAPAEACSILLKEPCCRSAPRRSTCRLDSRYVVLVVVA